MPQPSIFAVSLNLKIQRNFSLNCKTVWFGAVKSSSIAYSVGWWVGCLVGPQKWARMEACTYVVAAIANLCLLPCKWPSLNFQQWAETLFLLWINGPQAYQKKSSVGCGITTIGKTKSEQFSQTSSVSARISKYKIRKHLPIKHLGREISACV